MMDLGTAGATQSCNKDPVLCRKIAENCGGSKVILGNRNVYFS